jgi:twitching motility protein PilT
MSEDTRNQPRLQDLLSIMVRQGASDLILKVGSCPAMRVVGEIRFAGDMVLSHGLMASYLAEVLDQRGHEELQRLGASDQALSIPDLGRFRCNAFHQCGDLGMVFRCVKSEIPSFQGLNLPVEPLQGAMLEYINQNSHKHIITVEDPIEFLFEDRCSIVSQREIGTDVSSFPEALRSVVRQSPDVILIGEMRDRETVEAAMSAAESGYLVLSTLHTVNAVQTVERITSFFEPHEQAAVRMQLALNLAGVVSLRLVKTKAGEGMVPACELLINTPTIRDLLQRGDTYHLPKALQDGGFYGTMTFNQSLVSLFEAGNISLESALEASDSPDELKMQLRGISAGSNLTMGMDLPRV